MENVTLCPKCNGTGWEQYMEGDIQYVKKCSCGIYDSEVAAKQLKFAEIPGPYKNSYFSDLKSCMYSDENKKIFIKDALDIKRWFNNIGEMEEKGIGLYIYSRITGSGKTKTVCSVANEIMKSTNRTVKFSTAPRIKSEIQDSWSGLRNNELQLIEELSRTDILIIDDFGIKAFRDWENEKFFQIINGRYENQKITIFTSNYKISDLKCDDRIKSRILERSIEIHFPEESVRERLNKETMERFYKEV